MNLDAVKSARPKVLASACKATTTRLDDHLAAWTVEGIGDTPGVVLISTATAPRAVRLDQQGIETFTYDPAEGLLYVRFPNEARPRELSVEF